MSDDNDGATDLALGVLEVFWGVLRHPIFWLLLIVGLSGWAIYAHVAS